MNIKVISLLAVGFLVGVCVMGAQRVVVVNEDDTDFSRLLASYEPYNYQSSSSHSNSVNEYIVNGKLTNRSTSDFSSYSYSDDNSSYSYSSNLNRTVVNTDNGFDSWFKRHYETGYKSGKKIIVVDKSGHKGNNNTGYNNNHDTTELEVRVASKMDRSGHPKVSFMSEESSGGSKKKSSETVQTRTVEVNKDVSSSKPVEVKTETKKDDDENKKSESRTNVNPNSDTRKRVRGKG